MTSTAITAMINETLEELSSDALDLPCLFVDGVVQHGYIEVPTNPADPIRFLNLHNNRSPDCMYFEVPGDITAGELASLVGGDSGRTLIQQFISGDDSNIEEFDLLIHDMVASRTHCAWDVAEWLQNEDVVRECEEHGLHAYIDSVAKDARRGGIALWSGNGSRVNRAAITAHVRQQLEDAEVDD